MGNVRGRDPSVAYQKARQRLQVRVQQPHAGMPTANAIAIGTKIPSFGGSLALMVTIHCVDGRQVTIVLTKIKQPSGLMAE